jgi:hypothetical protein
MTELHSVAAHLRRVRTQLQRELTGPSLPGRYVRLTAARMAYTDLLVHACGMLQIPTVLARATGRARDLEVLRVEAALARYGLVT